MAKKILILDDVADAAVLIGKILKKCNHDTVNFTDEEDAINYAKSNHVDLAILDLKLKKMSGTEVLSILKKESPKTKIIMLTGYPSISTAREAMSLGASEYLVKPIDRDELESKVAKVLEL